MKNKLLTALGILAITALTFHFPGHTWLQSDTQIYIPIFEHLYDPSVLGGDLIVQHPHIAYTVYDDVTIWMRRLTGLDFFWSLKLQQAVWRTFGVWGLYLLAAAMGLPRALSLLTAAIVSLGATISGPAVLSIEYEPVPRGFAVALMIASMGFAVWRRLWAAAVAAALAFLYHAPTVLPLYAVYGVWWLWPPLSKEELRRKGVMFVPLAAAAALIFTLSRAQAVLGEGQPFFTAVGPELEVLQRMRASYNWLSIWASAWLPHYALLWVATLLASWRLWRHMSLEMRFMAIGMPLFGVLSLPAQYVLLEKWKWALLPQIQLQRAILFITLMAMLLGAVAACLAVRERRYWEAPIWFVLAYLIPTNVKVWQLPAANRIGVVLALAALATVSVWWYWRNQRGGPVLVATVATAAFFLVPSWGGIANYARDLHKPDLEALARWARESTPKSSMFLFPDAGKSLEPGIFRAESLRPLWADWKAGGQVNYFPGLAHEWYARWKDTMEPAFSPARVAHLTSLGIDYIVLTPKNRLPDQATVYENSRYLVYRLTPRADSPPVPEPKTDPPPVKKASKSSRRRRR